MGYDPSEPNGETVPPNILQCAIWSFRFCYRRSNKVTTINRIGKGDFRISWCKSSSFQKQIKSITRIHISSYV